MAQVVHACPDATHYVRGGIRSWGDLVVASDTIRKALGVGPQAWGEARRVLGEAGAAVT
ncbi:replication initiation protein RepC, partial [Klebsiella aerogenes]|uniref:replication initiation protein RepC n=1 Tax=Klebsiella aerogenes TaxID=548 RepID=UPI001D1288E7